MFEGYSQHEKSVGTGKISCNRPKFEGYSQRH